jgi:hypothetical protein
VTMSRLESAIEAGEDFERDVNGRGGDGCYEQLFLAESREASLCLDQYQCEESDVAILDLEERGIHCMKLFALLTTTCSVSPNIDNPACPDLEG